MARIFIDGFESGGLDLWDTVGGNASVIAAPAGMTGSYALKMLNAGTALIKNVSAGDEFYISFLFKPTNTGAFSLVQFRFGANVLIDIKRNASFFLEVYRSTTLIATGTAVLATGTVHHVQIHAKIADAGGIVQIKLADALPLDVDFTGDTKPGTDTQINAVYLGVSPSGATEGNWDNVVIDNAAWPGSTLIQAIKPTGAGATTQWTPSAGANWDCVDEVPASDVDNVVVNANDQVDTYSTGNLTGSIGSVVCVQVQARSVKEGAATPQNLALVVRPVATDRPSADLAVPSTARSLYNLWMTNPDTAVAWTESGVNGMEIGIKSRA